MKKIITLLLCAVMVLGLFACDSTAEKPAATEGKLKVGFGRTDITPEYSVQLKGYFQAANRWSSNVLDPLYASCVAFTDSKDNTVLLFHMDLVGCGGTVIPFARKAIGEATGVPMDNIMVAGTHTHSAPMIDSDHVVMVQYNKFLQEQMIAAAEAAMKDRKPAEMYTTSTTLKNMNFVRHYRMDDGSVVGDNFGTPDGKSYVDHVKKADNEMQLIRFKREGGKDVVLVNWQVHPHRTGGTYLGDISADIVGSMRMALEPQMDCYMAYFTGASGNLNPTSRIASENITGDYIEQGAMMARDAILACDNMTKQKSDKVQILRRDMQVTTNGMATKIITYAFAIGDVGFISVPYEMFDTNGKFVKDNSPYDTTFVVTCSNFSNGYVPAEWAYYEDVTAYEVASRNYDKGTAETLANGYVEMLNELHSAK